MTTFAQRQTQVAGSSRSSDASAKQATGVPPVRAAHGPLQRAKGYPSAPSVRQGDSVHSAVHSSGESRQGAAYDLSRIPVFPPVQVANWATPGSASVLRRTCSCGGSCSDCKKRRTDEKEKKLRTKRAGGGDFGQATAPPIVQETLRSSGRPLDAATRAFMEPRFGQDFSRVRVHTGGNADESARAVDALAYTVGRNVVFANGQYAPHTPVGARLLAHELAHTVQNPDGGELSPFLEVGRVDDPAEHAADRAADAVLRGESPSLASAGGARLRRQRAGCSASPAEQDDQRKVSCPDGDYLVTLSTSSKPADPEVDVGDYHTKKETEVPKTQTSVNAGFNGTRVSLKIGICRGGTKVTITPSVDLPQAVEKALGNVISGSKVLTGVKISPELEITLIRTNGATVTLSPSVTVDEHGVSGGGGSVTVKTKDVTVKGGVSYDERTHGGSVNISVSGGSPQPKVDCHGTETQYLTLHCERITKTPAVPPTPAETKTDTEVRYVFFKHAEHKVRPDFRLPTDIQSLYDRGFRVTAIDGYTSPEGPRDPGPGFEGNIALGQERADAALTWLTREACPKCEVPQVDPAGHSELPPEQGKVEPEPKGPGMEREAVKEFLGKGPGQTPDPLSPQDPKERAAFERLPQSKQRDQAFELMRRAAITFQHTQVVKEATEGKPAEEKHEAANCSPEVVNAARGSFGIF
jgi:Domain of unknown function (DUF4157)